MQWFSGKARAMAEREKAVVTGLAVRTGIGDDFRALIHGLEKGAFASIKPFFPECDDLRSFRAAV